MYFRKSLSKRRSSYDDPSFSNTGVGSSLINGENGERAGVDRTMIPVGIAAQSPSKMSMDDYYSRTRLHFAYKRMITIVILYRAAGSRN